jgi:hypothetical protein
VNDLRGRVMGKKKDRPLISGFVIQFRFLIIPATVTVDTDFQRGETHPVGQKRQPQTVPATRSLCQNELNRR